MHADEADYRGGRAGFAVPAPGFQTSDPSPRILIGPFSAGNPPGPSATLSSTPTAARSSASLAVLDRYTLVGFNSPVRNWCCRFSRSCAHMAAPIRFEMLNTRPTSGMRSMRDATKPNTAREGDQALSGIPACPARQTHRGRPVRAPSSTARLATVCNIMCVSYRAEGVPKITHVIFFASKSCARQSWYQRLRKNSAFTCARAHRLVQRATESQSADGAQNAQAQAGHKAERREQDCGEKVGSGSSLHRRTLPSAAHL